MRSLALALVFIVTACGAESAPAPATRPAEPPPSGALVDESPPTPPLVVPDMPEGFAPVLLEHATDSCDGPRVWVTPDAVTRTPPLEEGLVMPEAEARPEGAERDVFVATRPSGALGVLGEMSGSYNGPGGEPLFRYHLGRTRARPVLFVDRRVSRERFFAALRGAFDGVPLRLGGGGSDGAAHCVIALVAAPMDMPAQPTNVVRDARIDPEGALSTRGSDGTSIEIARAGAPLPGETTEGLHVLRIEAPAYAGVSMIASAFVDARWEERRYGWVELER